MKNDDRKPAIINKEFEEAVREMEKEVESRKSTPYERTRNAVNATGNKWAIENFNATHN